MGLKILDFLSEKFYEFKFYTKGLGPWVGSINKLIFKILAKFSAFFKIFSLLENVFPSKFLEKIL